MSLYKILIAYNGADDDILSAGLISFPLVFSISDWKVHLPGSLILTHNKPL